MKKHIRSRIWKTGQIVLFLLLVFLVSGAQAAKFSAKASLSTQEEYNDNIYLTEKNRTTDYITKVLPSLALDYKAPLWKWHGAYTLDFQHYANGSVADNFAHDLNVTNRIEPLRKFFYIDMTEQYTRTSLSLTRNYSQESLFVNQTDVNNFAVTPHFTLRPGAHTKVALGYTYQNTWYKSPSGVNKQDNSIYAEATDKASRNLELSAGAIYLMEHNDVEDYHKIDLHAGSRYRFAPDSYIFLTAGDGIFEFQRSGTSNQPFWDAGISRGFASFSAKIEASSQFVEDPTGLAEKVDTYSISMTSVSARTPFTISLSLGDYRDLRTKTLQTVSYGVTGTVSHKFTRVLESSASLTAQRLEDRTEDTYTNRLLSGLGLDYNLSRRVSLTLNYLFVYSHSPVVLTDRYLNNQLTAGVTATF
ncbi:MAG: TIGR03016 family PEP-CTERM system-associated outer membrane protein [Nitrospiraceae bacterium]|nr:TIGR03016 family PEP-CTERM system-associated outer membrane protein [Nitrospiraceae bacterium]